MSLTQPAGLSPSQGIPGILHFVALGQVTLHSLRNLPVHPEDSTEHAQKQRQLQEDQDLEVDAAEQRPQLEDEPRARTNPQVLSRIH